MNNYLHILAYLYAQITLLVALGSFLIGTVLFISAIRSKRQTPLHSIWFVLCLVIGLWNFCYYITMLPNISKSQALLASRISHAAGILIVPFFVQFSAILRPECLHKRKIALILCYASCLALAVLSLTSFVIPELARKLFMQYYPVGKLGYLLYVCAFVFSQTLYVTLFFAISYKTNMHN